MQGRRISYRKWSVSHKPVFDGTKPYALPKEEEADKMDDTNAPPTSPAKGGQPLFVPSLFLERRTRGRGRLHSSRFQRCCMTLVAAYVLAGHCCER